MKKSRNNICKCSHKESFHITPMSMIDSWPVSGCLGCIEHPTLPYELICRNFKLDNLKYLEEKYEKKHKSI